MVHTRFSRVQIIRFPLKPLDLLTNVWFFQHFIRFYKGFRRVGQLIKYICLSKLFINHLKVLP
jgi:hypothetical protein